jgi:hypothetical protein
MPRSFIHDFEWDPRKAQRYFEKHGVAFDRAAAVFEDPMALTQFDDEHSDDEERWITLGLDRAGTLLVVCHTYKELGGSTARIRIISARRASKREAASYGKR